MRTILLLFLSIFSPSRVVSQTPLQCLQGLLGFDRDNNEVLNFNEYRDMLHSFTQYYGESCSLPEDRQPFRVHFQIVACSCRAYESSSRHNCQCTNDDETVALPVSPPIYPEAYFDDLCRNAANFMKEYVTCYNATEPSTMEPEQTATGENDVSSDSDIMVPVIAGASAGVAVLFAVLLVWWCQRRNRVNENTKALPPSDPTSVEDASEWQVTKPRVARTARELPEETMITEDYEGTVDYVLKSLEEGESIERSSSDDSSKYVDSTIKSLVRQYNEASYKAREILEDNDVHIQSAFEDVDIDPEDPMDDHLGPVNLDDGEVIDASEITRHHSRSKSKSRRKKTKKGPVDMDELLEDSDTKNKAKKKPTPRSAKTVQRAYQKEKEKRRSSLDAIPEATLTEAPPLEL